MVWCKTGGPVNEQSAHISENSQSRVPPTLNNALAEPYKLLTVLLIVIG